MIDDAMRIWPRVINAARVEIGTPVSIGGNVRRARKATPLSLGQVRTAGSVKLHCGIQLLLSGGNGPS
jgi:hypothetical protein